MPASEARRIGLALHDFPAGGTERIAIRLANAWAGAGRIVTIYCGSALGPARAELAQGIAIVAADPPIPRGALSRLRLGRWLRGRLATDPPDVLVVPGNFHLPVIMAAGRLPCPVAAKLSNPLLRADHRFDKRIAGIGRRIATHRIDRLIAMSPALAAEAEALLGRACVPLAEPILSADPRTPVRPDGPPLVLCAGRMVAQKRFSLALRAFAALEDASARLVMLGDGPERAALEGEATALGIAERVEFIGHVPDITPWLARAHAFLLTSRYEGYPAVLVEAIAAGVPVVTTPCSVALPGIVAEPACGRIADEDPAALAAALSGILADGAVDEPARLALLARHEAGAAAAAWLAMLDNLVAERAV
ncbi:glycosyltransferase [Sphingomonas solaris]|uniref:Glycosyltransferase n=1 Tax=Alterirhizorhabdus solaris TaxID=2529389 RepID=A0A558R506_9SPHN|nr:glycosyltransferase [Sphingomonas solaris]TVV74456.1 glycosyltransferase [Sphingomonas solaris]